MNLVRSTIWWLPAIAIWAMTPVQAQSISDAESYLAHNATQQEIFLTRQLRAQDELVETCAPGLTAETFRPQFNTWLAENPRFRARSAQLALTAALVDLCKQPE